MYFSAVFTLKLNISSRQTCASKCIKVFVCFFPAARLLRWLMDVCTFFNARDLPAASGRHFIHQVLLFCRFYGQSLISFFMCSSIICTTLAPFLSLDVLNNDFCCEWVCTNTNLITAFNLLSVQLGFVFSMRFRLRNSVNVCRTYVQECYSRNVKAVLFAIAHEIQPNCTKNRPMTESVQKIQIFYLKNLNSKFNRTSIQLFIR